MAALNSASSLRALKGEGIYLQLIYIIYCVIPTAPPSAVRGALNKTSWHRLKAQQKKCSFAEHTIKLLVVAGYHGDGRHQSSERDEATLLRKSQGAQLDVSHLTRHTLAQEGAVCCQREGQTGSKAMDDSVLLLSSPHEQIRDAGSVPLDLSPISPP